MSALIKAFAQVDHGAENMAVPNSAVGFLLAQRSLNQPLLVVTASSRRASEIMDELETYLGKNCAVGLPPWETLPHEKLSPKSDTVAARIKVIAELNEAKIVIASVRALIQPIAPIEIPFLSLEIDLEVPMEFLLSHLALLGYNRTDLVAAILRYVVESWIFSCPIRIIRSE